ncbi:MAG: ankyrin repeat domain-containing protein [Terriglobales bacterium]
MKRIGFVCIAVAVVFLLSNVASAANWVLAERDDSNKYVLGNFTTYVDADSVVRNGPTLSFWMLTVFDEPAKAGLKMDLTKYEIKLVRPLWSRLVEEYTYNPDGSPKAVHDYYDSELRLMGKSEPYSQAAVVALKYAKEGTLGKGNTPTPIQESSASPGVLDKTLIEAARDGRANEVIAALEKGANVDAFDKDDGTALTVAISYEHFDMAKLLISRGADVNQAGYSSNTPLTLAAYMGVLDLVRTLIEKGADVNKAAQYANGHPPATALMLVREMIQKGHEEVSLSTGQSHTVPLSPEERSRYQEIERLLKAAGAK